MPPAASGSPNPTRPHPFAGIEGGWAASLPPSDDPSFPAQLLGDTGAHSEDMKGCSEHLPGSAWHSMARPQATFSFTCHC